MAEDRTWRLRARCAGLPPSMFILDRGHQPQQAQAVCNGSEDFGDPCPVRAECKAFADENGYVGVWGGEYISSRDYGTVEARLEEAIMDIGSVVVRLQDGRPRNDEAP